MPIDRTQLKLQARQVIAEYKKPSPLAVGLAYLVLSLVISLLSQRLLSSNMTVNTLNSYMSYFQAGDYDKVLSVASGMCPTPMATLLNLALQLVLDIVSAGFLIYLLNCVRRTAPVIGNLLDGFAIWWKIILLNLLIGLFEMLWGLLLVVPGIIASYRYRQAIYILLDNPDLSVMECIRRSKAMMEGRKWELFVLDLSFIGWYLLSSFPYFGYFVQIWTLPYFNMTYTLYYEKLRIERGAERPVYENTAV